MAKQRMELVEEIVVKVKELEWAVSVPCVGDDEEVPGLIIGRAEYVDRVIDCLDKAGFTVKGLRRH